MRILIVAAAVAFLCGPAFAETLKFSSGQVTTHRGAGLVLTIGANEIDRKNTMTCASDAGSLVIETQFVEDTEQDDAFLAGIICTYVDDVAADPGCVKQIGSSTLTSFQGKPSLPKGTHVVHTTFSAPPGMTYRHISSYQLVYTLYQHQ